MSKADQSALAALYKDALTELTNFARSRLRNASDAEDVVQEAFARLQRVQTEKTVENPKGFLFTVTSNLIIDRLRERQRFQPRVVDKRTGGLTDPLEDRRHEITPEEEVEKRDDLNRVLAAVEKLPPQAQRVFLLHKIRHLSYAEVAAHLGIAKSTVEKHMIRALSELSAVLAEDEENPDDR